MTVGPAGETPRPDGELLRAVERLDYRRAVSERPRLVALLVHATAAVLIAPGFAATRPTGAAWAVIRAVPGATVTLGLLLAVGGAVLGLATLRRSPRWERRGLFVLVGWHLFVTVAFAAALAAWWAGPRVGAAPPLYLPVVYAQLAALLMVHLGAVRQVSRA